MKQLRATRVVNWFENLSSSNGVDFNDNYFIEDEDDLFLSPSPMIYESYLNYIYNLHGHKTNKPKIRIDHVDDQNIDAIAEYAEPINKGPQPQIELLNNTSSFADVKMSDEIISI